MHTNSPTLRQTRAKGWATRVLGAAAATTYDLALGAMNGRLPNAANLAVDAALGGLAGGIAGQLTPKVPGRLPDPFAPRPLPDYGPKALQVLKGAGLGGYFGTLLNQLKNMSDMQCRGEAY